MSRDRACTQLLFECLQVTIISRKSRKILAQSSKGKRHYEVISMSDTNVALSLFLYGQCECIRRSCVHPSHAISASFFRGWIESEISKSSVSVWHEYEVSSKLGILAKSLQAPCATGEDNMINAIRSKRFISTVLITAFAYRILLLPRLLWIYRRLSAKVLWTLWRAQSLHCAGHLHLRGGI